MPLLGLHTIASVYMPVLGLHHTANVYIPLAVFTCHFLITYYCQYLHALLGLHHTTSVCLPLLGLHTTGSVDMPLICLHSTGSFGMPLPGLHTTVSACKLLPVFSLAVIHCLGYQITSGRSFHLSWNGGHRQFKKPFLIFLLKITLIFELSSHRCYNVRKYNGKTVIIKSQLKLSFILIFTFNTEEHLGKKWS